MSLYTPAEQALREVESGLMGCRLSAEHVLDFASEAGVRGETIIEGWIRAGLVRESGGQLVLEEKGVWLHGNIVESLRELLHGRAEERVTEPSA